MNKQDVKQVVLELMKDPVIRSEILDFVIEIKSLSGPDPRPTTIQGWEQWLFDTVNPNEPIP